MAHAGNARRLASLTEHSDKGSSAITPQMDGTWHIHFNRWIRSRAHVPMN